jgi:hypothetical protein
MFALSKRAVQAVANLVHPLLHQIARGILSLFADNLRCTGFCELAELPPQGLLALLRGEIMRMTKTKTSGKQNELHGETQTPNAEPKTKKPYNKPVVRFYGAVRAIRSAMGFGPQPAAPMVDE